MEDLLTPVSKTYLKRTEEPLLASSQTKKEAFQVPSSIDEALDTLKAEPDYDALISVLRFLSVSDGPYVRIANPGPQSAQIIQVLISDIAPNYWPLLEVESSDGSASDPRAASDLDLFLSCLRNITGINGVLVRLRAVIQEYKEQSRGPMRSDLSLNLAIILQVLTSLLDGDDTASNVWRSTTFGLANAAKRKPLVQEYVALLASSIVVSVAAEAEDIIKSTSNRADKHWIADGLQYSKWLGRNIGHWARHTTSDEDMKICSSLLARVLRLGYADAVIKGLAADLLLTSTGDPGAFLSLTKMLSGLEQRQVLFTLLRYLSERFLNQLDTSTHAQSPVISAAAGIIKLVVGSDEIRKNHLVNWLTGSSWGGLGDGIGIRRAAIAALAQDKDSIGIILDKSIAQFGDQLYIKHSPMLQQEVHAEVLLLSAGYLHRQAPTKLKISMKSTPYLSMISNRIGSAQTKTRLLGMYIGEALSSLADTGPVKLDFHMDETHTEEATWYKGLVKVYDEVGPIEPLVSKPKTNPPGKGLAQIKKPENRPKPKALSKAQAPQSGFIIEEVDEGSEEDDIVPYAKPDSDPEDSDDDPTLIRRNKPKAPVYIRDLITYLRDTDNYDKQKLALNTAPVLIRRKANFGTEVKEHVDELASLLVGLQDNFDLDDFYELRLQGMIALVTAQPQTMAPWFARIFFEGDYSISQRASILVVLGLSAREIAGFDASEYAAAASFPSKELPDRIEKMYLGGASTTKQLPSSSLKALPPNALDTVARSLTSSFLDPISSTAADAVTGPDFLKLASVKDSLKAKKAAVKTKPRIRTIPNTTASIISTAFFFPLTARFQHALRASSASRAGLIFQPYLLSVFLKTLGVLIHAAGPATLGLPQMTAELWDLLLGVRAHCVGELACTHALLMALAALFDVNEDMRRLCEVHGRELVETQEWVAALFHGMRGDGEGGEEHEVKQLAAGILIKLHEAVEKYRLLLIGDTIGLG